MSTAVATTKDFQERMFERIRDQMGDLLTEDDLRKIVEAAVQKAFFEERRGEYGRTVEPVFVEMMRGLMQSRVSAAIEKWLADNPEEVNKVIQDVIAKGFLGMISHSFEARLSWPLQQFAQELKDKGVLG